MSLMIGTVEFLSSGQDAWKEATEGMELAGGDKIRTGNNGMASILFSNGSIVTLKPNTEFEIQSLSISKDEDSVEYKLQLTRGKLRAILEELGEGSSFEIRTPTAVAAVRGTLFYLYVREVTADELPEGVEERLMTELFVEEGGVLYINTISGKFYAVSVGSSSNSYEDGNITEPFEVPPDKQQEWRQGWEDILAAEPYQEPAGGDPDLGEGEGGDGGDSTGGDRQSDNENKPAAGFRDLIDQALETKDNALEAAIRAQEASDNANKAGQDLDKKRDELDEKKNEINAVYNDTLATMDNAESSYDYVNGKIQEVQEVLNDVGAEVSEEANKASGLIIVDTNTLTNQYNNYNTEFNNTLNDAADIKDKLDDLIDELSGPNAGIKERLDTASADAAYWAQRAKELAEELAEAVRKAFIEGEDATTAANNIMASLSGLVKAVQQAITEADQAIADANQASAYAEGLLGDASNMLAEMDDVIDRFKDVAGDAQEIKGQLTDVIASIEDLIDGADGVKNVLQSLIADQLRHEKDLVWKEMVTKLLEREYLRDEIRRILQDNSERRVEGYVEKISDAQTGKVLKDIHGNRVRVEQYVLRPASDVVELLNVNLRAGEDLTTMEWTTRFNKSLDSLPTGELKRLPWNDYLDTRWAWTAYIYSPYREDGRYPEEMWVEFSHNSDDFAEGRKFSERDDKKARQTIYDRQLLIKNFNDNGVMKYKENREGDQPAGTYSILSRQQNADIGGAGNNPRGFQYNFASTAGEQASIDAAFYVVSDTGIRQDGYKSLRIDDIWDALRVNMAGSNKVIGDNNLEMRFSSAALFQFGAIDMIYIPFDRMDWKDDQHIPEYSLP